jgi:two-component system phosphate regulon sensor histidine kinase PhoR
MRSRLTAAWHSPAIRIATTALVVITVLSATVTVAFFLTRFIYQLIGRQPPALAAQLINTLLGFFFFGLMMFGVGLVFRQRQHRFFGPILDAMDRISKGDFTTRLEEYLEAAGQFGELVRSVNNLASELHQTEQMRQEFISNVSHEIQSPLTSIRGFARALQEDDLNSETRQHYLSIIETESMRLSKLSDNLLALASLDSEQIKLEPRPYRLDKQIRGLILACEPQWAGKRLDMDVALDEASITADEDLLSQVWINLIHNSIKFTPAGGCVRVALRQQAGRLEVQVADTGVGIAAEDLAHVFERFYKADKARRRSEGGNGLGLSIVKKIVEMHHGTLAVESQPEAGTKFTVGLPEKQFISPNNSSN